MTDWTAGYVADIGYTFGYYTELNPRRIRLPLLNQGWNVPEITTGCELGFGQGLSVSIHAANSNVHWYGTDFNPAQAACAREFSEKSGSSAQLYDQSFAEFAERDDLPEFDYIGLHGIWSWISDENRNVIVDFIRRRLRVGGVVYVSYNTQPGWAAFAPLRHLMTEHAQRIGSEGSGIVSRIDEAVIFAEKLLETEPMYARANPLVGDRLKKVKDQDRHYLAHEYFNKDWHPMHFATMADCLESAKLTYAGSAHYLDHIDSINLTNEQQAFIKEIPDQLLRESVRDFMVNQQFRRDYWIKGPRRLDPVRQNKLLRETRVILITPRQDVSLTVNSSLGDAKMSEAVYNPLLDILADHQIKTVDELIQKMKPLEVNFAQVVQALMVLAGAGHVTNVQDDAEIEQCAESSEKLNQHLLNLSLGSTDISYLGSPVIGGAILMPRVPQFFINAIKQGAESPEDWAAFAWQALSALNQRLVVEGKPLEDPADNIKELKRQAAEFQEKRLPVLKALKII